MSFNFNFVKEKGGRTGNLIVDVNGTRVFSKKDEGTYPHKDFDAFFTAVEEAF